MKGFSHLISGCGQTDPLKSDRSKSGMMYCRHSFNNNDSYHSPNVPSPVTTVTYFFLFRCALESVTFLVTFFRNKTGKNKM